MHHQGLIRAHQGIIRASSASHQCIISASSAHHQRFISVSEHIISASSGDQGTTSIPRVLHCLLCLVIIFITSVWRLSWLKIWKGCRFSYLPNCESLIFWVWMWVRCGHLIEKMTQLSEFIGRSRFFHLYTNSFGNGNFILSLKVVLQTWIRGIQYFISVFRSLTFASHT